jgi:molybdopterin-guanine dinucleotide biosynthesis protein A
MPAQGLPMAEKASVIVLAGGKSIRMGRDKAWMMLDGEPLIERVVRRLLPLAAEVLVSGTDSQRYEALLRRLPVAGRVVADQYPGFGPLAGMQAGLSAAGNDLALVVAADMPFVNITLLRHLIDLAPGYDGVVPNGRDPRKHAGGLEPLHALYRRSCLPAIEKHLAANDRQVLCFFEDVRIRIIPDDEIRALDPDLLSFFNVNTPEDWQDAQRVLAQATARRLPT